MSHVCHDCALAAWRQWDCQELAGEYRRETGLSFHCCSRTETGGVEELDNNFIWKIKLICLTEHKGNRKRILVHNCCTNYSYKAGERILVIVLVNAVIWTNFPSYSLAP